MGWEMTLFAYLSFLIALGTLTLVMVDLKLKWDLWHFWVVGMVVLLVAAGTIAAGQHMNDVTKMFIQENRVINDVTDLNTEPEDIILFKNSDGANCIATKLANYKITKIACQE
jgi:hypothetical protein